MLTMKYNRVTTGTAMQVIIGSDRAGFFTSSVTSVIASKPSYAHRPWYKAKLSLAIPIPPGVAVTTSTL